MKIILILAILAAMLTIPTVFGVPLNPTVSASTPVMAQDVQETSPIVALKDLYDNNTEFRTTMDKAFANMKDPDPNTADLWPSPTAVNPWKGKKFDDLLQFFGEWYQLKPTPSGAQDEFNFIEKFAWFYYENEFGQKIVGEEPGLNWTRQFVEARAQIPGEPAVKCNYFAMDGRSIDSYGTVYHSA